MDEKLEHILQQVKLLCEQNPEFKEKLRELFPSTKHIYSSDDRVDRIEKYLGLDFLMDSHESSIDYSFVSIPEVRWQLESDNREMYRYRYGTRYHMIEFGEFCRYALLQAEMLLNYYYDSTTESFIDVKNIIKKYNSSANIENCKSIGAISFNIKIWAFRTQFDLLINIADWDNVRKVRNALSHRSPSADVEIEIASYKKKLEDANFPLNADGLVNYYKLKENEVLKNIFDSKYKSTKEYIEYSFLVWLQKQPFDSIVSMLEELACEVKNKLAMVDTKI